MNISIVVPVLNEASLIRDFLQHLRERAREAEIVVADGGSSDGTAEIAEKLCDRVVRAPPGRARQLNAGADVARGDVLWFLHADVRVPVGCLEEIARAMTDSRVAGGFFRIRLPRQAFIYRLTDSFAHYAGLLLRLRYSDHGFFCRREVFERIGGFPDVPLMEDADFFRKLSRQGRVRVIPQRLEVDPRRYESVGAAWLTFVYGLISVLYLLHAPRPQLLSIYRRFCCRS